MNKEQIIDKAYKNYLKGGDIKWLKQTEVDTPIGKMNIPTPYTKEEFFNKCKTDSEFSEKWGLKIEERELSWKERCKIATGKDLSHNELNNSDKYKVDYMYEHNIPTKLITITYNNEKIESYE
jgi:hypothetical protein